MDRWFEAYTHWPAGNQLIFSICAIIFGVLILFMVGIFVVVMCGHLVVLCRGHKSRQVITDSPRKLLDSLLLLARKRTERLALPLSAVGPDWKEEVRRCRRDQAAQAAEEEYQLALAEEQPEPVAKVKRTAQGPV